VRLDSERAGADESASLDYIAEILRSGGDDEAGAAAARLPRRGAPPGTGSRGRFDRLQLYRRQLLLHSDARTEDGGKKAAPAAGALSGTISSRPWPSR